MLRHGRPGAAHEERDAFHKIRQERVQNVAVVISWSWFGWSQVMQNRNNRLATVHQQLILRTQSGPDHAKVTPDGCLNVQL